jgi:hypothetical protein
MTKTIAVTLTLAGLYFLWTGFNAHVFAESVLHQIYGTMNLIGGFLLVGVAAMVGGIGDISDRVAGLPSRTAEDVRRVMSPAGGAR